MYSVLKQLVALGYSNCIVQVIMKTKKDITNDISTKAQS